MRSATRFPTTRPTAFYQTVPGDLDLWLDEVLSHWMWHAAWVGLSILMLAAATRGTVGRPDRTSVTAVAAGLVHGATFFLVSVEGADDAARHPGIDPDPCLVRAGRAPRPSA